MAAVEERSWAASSRRPSSPRRSPQVRGRARDAPLDQSHRLCRLLRGGPGHESDRARSPASRCRRSSSAVTSTSGCHGTRTPPSSPRRSPAHASCGCPPRTSPISSAAIVQRRAARLPACPRRTASRPASPSGERSSATTTSTRGCRHDRSRRRLPGPDHALRLGRDLDPARTRSPHPPAPRVDHHGRARPLEEFRLHVRTGLAQRLEPCDLEEVLLQVAVYAGVPAANAAFHVASEVLNEKPH